MSQNYKDTLNLPRTDFPMKANLAAREPEMLRWEETRLYQEIQKSRDGRELFVLHDGPPFANGDVHMGTALNKILKDFVVKSQTMLGKRAPYSAWLGLSWPANRVQSGEGIARAFSAGGPQEMRSVCAKIHRHPARTIQAARRVRRLGTSVSDDGSQIRSGDSCVRSRFSLRKASCTRRRSLSSGAPARRPLSLKPKWNIKTATTPRFTSNFRSLVGGRRLSQATAGEPGVPAAVGEADSFPTGTSIAIWTTTPWTLPANLAIAVDAKENYVVQEFSRDGTV